MAALPLGECPPASVWSVHREHARATRWNNRSTCPVLYNFNSGSREGGDMINSKRMLAAAVVAALALAACGDDDDNAAPATTEGAAATVPAGAATTAPAAATTAPTGATTAAPSGGASGVKVGLLFDITCTGDKSFNDSAAAGLDKATTDLGIVPSHSCPTGDDDRKPRLDLAVQDG